eukprot:gene3968-7224_t
MSSIDNLLDTDPVKLEHYYQLMLALEKERRINEAIQIGEEAYQNGVVGLKIILEEHFEGCRKLLEQIRYKLRELKECY